MFMSPFIAEQGGPPSGTSGDWWLGPWPAPYESVGVIDPSYVTMAYQPKWAVGTVYERADAATYANSLINLNDPGTNNAVTIVAPPWNLNTGWQGDGIGYLDTGITAGANQIQSIFCAFDSVTNFGVLCGALDAFTAVFIRSRSVDNTFRVCNLFLIEYANFPNLASGVLGFVSNTIFVNGVADGIVTTTTGPQAMTLYLLGSHSTIPPFVSNRIIGNVPAFVWYNTAISASQAAAVSAAMEAIRVA